MQTFLPSADFRDCATVLDRQRLGKQRVECLQILKCLTGSGTGWANHPAVRMWEGCTDVLAEYGLAICDEWILRGYKDTCRDKILTLVPFRSSDPMQPLWMGDLRLHVSHQSNLIRKFPEHYGPFWPDVSGNLPYFWPTNEKEMAQ
jgi:hypothetical protein